MEENTQEKEEKKEGLYSILLLLNEIRFLKERQKKIEREIRISNSMIVIVLTGIITFSDIPIFYKTGLIITASYALEDFREGLQVIFSNLKLLFIKKRD